MPGKRLKLELLDQKKEKTKEVEKQFKKAKKAVQILLPEEPSYLEADGMEHTYDYSQQEIANAVDIRAASKAFDLVLDDFGPYNVDYTQNGRYLAIGGTKGHIATMEWDSKKLIGEFHIKTAVRDIAFLHTHTMIAVAQKRRSCIYDHNGVELHVMKRHHDVQKFQFLPYHFLLVSISAQGFLTYQDTSTGEITAVHKTGLGFCRVMKQNPANAIIHLGHNNGMVTLWSPNSKEAVAKILAHKAPIASLAIDRTGRYMITAGQDAKMQVFDIRTWKSLFACKRYNVPFDMDLSQKDVLAVSHRNNVQMWKNPFDGENFELYMRHAASGPVQSVKFCPFEDILGVGHQHGFSSLLVPGSGEPNFDSLEANPMQSKLSRANHVVHSLLDKVPADMISLDASLFGTIQTKELSVEDQIRQVHPGFVRLSRTTKADTEEHTQILAREKRRIAAREIERKQKEKHVARQKEQKEFAQKPISEYSALDRFKKKK